MAGEIRIALSPSVQPGGRAPAPGELGLVQSFLNTHYDLEAEHGAEVLSSPAALARWLYAHGLLERAAALSSADLTRALEFREALREHTRARSVATAGALDEAARGAPVELRFEGGPRFALARGSGVEGSIGLLLAITARAMIDGSWRRMKICPGQHCGWAFYDHSRNQTGRWCSMSVCGGRAKARSHYRRRRVSAA